MPFDWPSSAETSLLPSATQPWPRLNSTRPVVCSYPLCWMGCASCGSRTTECDPLRNARNSQSRHLACGCRAHPRRDRVSHLRRTLACARPTRWLARLAVKRLSKSKNPKKVSQCHVRGNRRSDRVPDGSCRPQYHRPIHRHRRRLDGALTVNVRKQSDRKRGAIEDWEEIRPRISVALTCD